MNEETKQEIVTQSKIYWKEIIIIILFVGVIFTYWRLDEAKKDLAEAVRISTMIKTRDEINAGIAGVTQRESELYPKIDATIDSLNSSIKSLNEEVKKLKKPDKGKTNENFKKQNIQELSKWFTDNNFPNSISTSK